MPALIAASAIRSCFGDGARTFDALLRGECGATALRHGDPGRLGVPAGYHVGTDDPNRPFRASQLLAECLAEAVARAGLDATQRVVALVGTGLRELSAVEDWALTGARFPVRRLHFGDVVRDTVPGVTEVITLANACSAGGHALALAQDLVELGEADAVLVAAADVMTQSMLAMIGRAAPGPVGQVRPFDAERQGVLLGEGAAAMIIVPEADRGRGHRRVPAPRTRLVSTGLSCDAHHETAPDVTGITRAMRDAFERPGRDPAEVSLVLAHGTGTALNDPAECQAMREVLLAGGADPLVTAIKGAVGHTSGSAPLLNVDVALRCLATSTVPPVTGLRVPLDEGAGLRFATARPSPLRQGLVQVNAFGFGGVNAVTLLEAA
jgi:3-oxoacyl-[acyl-carrier-protein] synthase II